MLLLLIRRRNHIFLKLLFRTIRLLDYRLIGLVGVRQGDLGSVPGRVIPKTLKMVLDTSLLNTQ